MTEERRTNIMRSSAQLAAISVIFAIFALMKPEDDKWSQYWRRMNGKYKWLWSDLIDTMVVFEVYRSPIPSISLFSDVYSVLFGSKEAKDLLRYVPVLNSYKSVTTMLPDDTKDAIDDYVFEDESENENED